MPDVAEDQAAILRNALVLIPELETEVARLKRENLKLTHERNFLRKATMLPHVFLEKFEEEAWKLVEEMSDG